MSDIQLSISRSQIVSQLGTPIAEITDTTSGSLVLQYTSKAPSLADFYYLQSGKLVLTSISYYAAPKELTQYTGLYGAPAYSAYLSKTGNDSLRLIVHVWPQAGKTVTAIGPSAMAGVVREDTFAATTLENYLSGWGKSLVGNQIATISAEPTNIPVPIVTQPPSYSAAGGVSRYMGYGIIGAVIGIVLVVAIIRLALLRNKQEPPPPVSPPPSV